MTDEGPREASFIDTIKEQKRMAKICLVGDGGTGKTTFIRFMELGRLIGMDELARTPFMDIGTAKIEDHTVLMMDLAGQRIPDGHPLDHIPVTALRGSDLILFFFSIDNFTSFLSIDVWYKEIKNLFESWNMEIPPCILVGNKMDLERTVESINGKEWVENHHEFLGYYEVSLLIGTNVIPLVEAIRDVLLKK